MDRRSLAAGLGIIAIGSLITFLPFGREPGPTIDSLVPILVVAEAVFLAGLVWWYRIPPGRRRAMVPYRRLIPALAIWSLISVGATAAGSPSLGRALDVVPQDLRDWVAIVLSNTLAVGVTTALVGALVTFAAASRAVIRRVGTGQRSGRAG